MVTINRSLDSAGRPLLDSQALRSPPERSPTPPPGAEMAGSGPVAGRSAGRPTLSIRPEVDREATNSISGSGPARDVGASPSLAGVDGVDRLPPADRVAVSSAGRVFSALSQQAQLSVLRTSDQLQQLRSASPSFTPDREDVRALISGLREELRSGLRGTTTQAPGEMSDARRERTASRPTSSEAAREDERADGFAYETSELVRQQLKSQEGVAKLSEANTLNQEPLRLLD